MEQRIELGDGPSPHEENLAELKALNEKLDRLIEIQKNTQSWLVKIEANTKFRPLKGGGVFT